MSDYFTPTKADLTEGTEVRKQIEDQVEAWAPNYMEGEKVSSYRDLLDDRIDGMTIRVGDDFKTLDLGGSYSEAPYSTVRTIARKVVKEMTD